jgi:hypothetical protein
MTGTDSHPDQAPTSIPGFCFLLPLNPLLKGAMPTTEIVDVLSYKPSCGQGGFIPCVPNTRKDPPRVAETAKMHCNDPASGQVI